MRRGNLDRAFLAGMFLLVAGAVPALSCSTRGRQPGNGGGSGGTGGGTGGNNGNNDMQVSLSGPISVTPSDVTLDLVQGMPPPTQAFTVTLHDPAGDRDVTYGATFTLADLTLGAMSSNTFTAGTSHGGTTVLTASYTPPGAMQAQAQAMIHVRVKGSFPGPDCGNNGQPACPTFPPDNAPTCPATVAKPHIVYPPDGVLLPPNMSVISVMFTPWPGKPPTVKAYEVAFKNANTDVRIVTPCTNQTTDTSLVGGMLSPMPSGGCEVQLTAAQWDFVAKSNRGGAAVGVTVRATSDGMCATPSDNSAAISFAEQDLNGGVFYWKSTIINSGGIAGGVGGEIWAKSFGDATPETQISGQNNLSDATCFGCHSLSRDGTRMVVSFDDNDSDDEYSDITHTLMDVAGKKSIDGQTTYGHHEPGFQAIAPDNKVYVGTIGDLQDDLFNMIPGNALWMFDAMSGMPLATPSVTFGPTGSRPTMPDFSPDGKSLLFVLPKSVSTWGADDDHVFGGSIYTASYDATMHTFGMPTAVIASAGENNYYPSYSPDGSFIAFNRVPMQAGGTNCTNGGPQGQCPNDSYSNVKARVFVLQNKMGANPIDMEKANGSPAAKPIDVSNSWPRWSPFVQMYQGSKLLWITFSSTRDYGLRVLNHKPGLTQCYPPDSPQDPTGDHSHPFPDNCQQPQIWMAAINLAQVELGAQDPSFPAFWLPFQDITTHNHTAQWTQAVAGQPVPDMGSCIPNGGNCASNPGACCSQTCLGTGVCGMPIP
jgi:hypothetical protein